MKLGKKVFLIFITLCSFTFLVAQTQKGKATFYSKRATGTRTANGERVHHDSMTCAHRTHPFGTLLKVTNIKNKKEVIVRVTDRGPFSRGRVIDLSYAAAKKLGMVGQGVATVTVEPIDSTDIICIPYRTKDKKQLPEIDFGVSSDEENFIETWAKQQLENTKKTKKQFLKPQKQAASEQKKHTKSAQK